MQTFVFENECNISTDIMITGPNQVWLSSLCESKVYYFDNGNLKTYRLNNNDTIKCGIFYKDQSNNLFVFAHKYPTAPNDTLFTYKLSGNSFELLRTDFIDPYNPNGKNNNISRCGKDAIMLPNTNVNNSQNLYYFNGSEWIVHSYPTDSARQTKIGGISRDSLVALCMPYDDIYTYGSGKWRSENRSVHIKGGIDAFTNIEVKFGNVYLTSCDYFNLLGWIIVGKPNKNTVTKTK
jgi:hypothetical protein